LKEQANLEDVLLEEEWQRQDINRFLVRNIDTSRLHIEYLGRGVAEGEHGQQVELSDSQMVLCCIPLPLGNKK